MGLLPAFGKRKVMDMRKIFWLLVILLFLPSFLYAGERVRGHWKDTDRDGMKDTWVQPYERTSPNTQRFDNYGYPGNFNPNTGRFTPKSQSPRETYPLNPNPYEPKRNRDLRW
jgi:hypothetical protein